MTNGLEFVYDYQLTSGYFCPTKISARISIHKQMVDYSTKKISRDLVEEVRQALKNIKGWGSIEIYVQDHKVVQITERNIKKTNHSLSSLQ